VAVFENRQFVTEAKSINKSSWFILLLNVVRLLEPKPIREKKLSIYSSHRHIAKPYMLVAVVLRCIIKTAMTQINITQ